MMVEAWMFPVGIQIVINGVAVVAGYFWLKERILSIEMRMGNINTKLDAMEHGAVERTKVQGRLINSITRLCDHAGLDAHVQE
jgi:hypothetical protein